MRKTLHQVSVFESAGFAFVSITNKITRNTFRSGQETPLHPGWKPSSASSTQTALLYFFSYFFGLFPERIFESRIAAFFAVYFKRIDARNRNFIKQQLFSHNQALIISFFQWVTL